MDGYRFFTSLLTLALLFQAPASSAATNRCAWSCGKISQSTLSQNLRPQADQVQLFLAGKASCALSESFDHSDRNLRTGALQALAISTQSCNVPSELNITTKQFLYQVMTLQGLKLSPENKVLKAKDLEPSQLFKNYKTYSCINEISTGENIRPGDILISKGDEVVIDSIGVDPFGVDEKVRQNSKLLDRESDFKNVPEASQIVLKAKLLCDDWMKDPSQFKISVFDYQGRSSFFPKYGKSSSLWVTAITERAVNACVLRVSEEIATRSKGKVPTQEFIPLPMASDVKVLRHDSEAVACRIGRTAVPKIPDLDCVQCCDFNAGFNLKEEK